MHELATKQAIKECSYCTESKNKIVKYDEDLEKERVRECLKALEREKIAKGMQCSKNDEIALREIQRQQMEEKKNIERSQTELDMMWHQLLLEDVRIKEEQEYLRAEKLKQEMLERRLAYDEQISSANRRRREALQYEREIENRRLEKMKNKMEQDYYDAIKRKKDQQMKNKMNYLEGYQMKVTRLMNEKRQENDKDIRTINTAMEDLRRERREEIARIQSLKMGQKIFVDNYLREKRIAEDMERETERIASKWKEEQENEADDVIRHKEVEQRNNRIKAAKEYQNYLEDRRREENSKCQKRKEIMARVKETAHEELRKKMDEANKELSKQIKYRHILSNQIRDNQIIMEMESNEMNEIQRPFTKKAISFKDAMKDKAKFGTNSENPVHPFARQHAIQKRSDLTNVPLPLIKKIN